MDGSEYRRRLWKIKQVSNVLSVRLDAVGRLANAVGVFLQVNLQISARPTPQDMA